VRGSIGTRAVLKGMGGFGRGKVAWVGLPPHPLAGTGELALPTEPARGKPRRRLAGGETAETPRLQLFAAPCRARGASSRLF
jgi:hypothetical protein